MTEDLNDKGFRSRKLRVDPNGRALASSSSSRSRTVTARGTFVSGIGVIERRFERPSDKYRRATSGRLVPTENRDWTELTAANIPRVPRDPDRRSTRTLRLRLPTNTISVTLRRIVVAWADHNGIASKLP